MPLVWIIILAILVGLCLLAEIKVIVWLRTKYGITGNPVVNLLLFPFILLGIIISDNGTTGPPDYEKL
jgi:hypothetical protein